MPRLRSTRTGVVVSVDDDTAARLGGIYYEPVEQPQKATTRKRTAAKSDDKK